MSCCVSYFKVVLLIKYRIVSLSLSFYIFIMLLSFIFIILLIGPKAHLNSPNFWGTLGLFLLGSSQPILQANFTHERPNLKLSKQAFPRLGKGSFPTCMAWHLCACPSCSVNTMQSLLPCTALLFLLHQTTPSVSQVVPCARSFTIAVIFIKDDPSAEACQGQAP